jgi:signal transduction histidine kinase
MRLREVWRTTTFRLTALYGLVFALGVVALLGMVYWQSTVFLARRVDGILHTEANAIAAAPRGQIHARIAQALLLNGARSNFYALFHADGTWVAGNLRVYPTRAIVDGPSITVPPTPAFPSVASLIVRGLPTGDRLVVGRDASQFTQMRAIILSALVWSGAAIIVVGLACGTALSLAPLQRLRILQEAGQDIAAGNLKRRMPTSHRRDELDMFASTVNLMLGEVERLMSEVKGATETIAHDLRTPLTRARAQLHRLQEAGAATPAQIGQVTEEIDTVLERFRALLRISEIEARDRRQGFAPTDLATIVLQAGDLYQPLAEDADVAFAVCAQGPAVIEADPKLLFEAISNLVDNAIKFTGPGGAVSVRLEPGPRIVVQDNGPGVPEDEREAVLQRFYRSERDRGMPGSGLGLSIVAAIARLHRLDLALEDARPGLRVVISRAAAD